MQKILTSFKQTLESAHGVLAQISEAESEKVPADGKWSKKEILGHLIDSAANNHQRFVRVQLTNQLTLPGYEQEKWVAIQNYKSAAWRDLCLLWESYNQHLLHLITNIPETRLAHTFRLEGGPEVTLEYWVEDYLKHLQHHLKQILG